MTATGTLDFAGVADALRRVTVEVTDDGEARGSGVLWPRGYVVTNAHVVRRAHVALTLADGRRLAGDLVARDPDADLSLLRVPDTDLPTAMVADTIPIRVGALVVAVGHPLGVRGALTAGIVHAVGPLARGGRSWIQADVSLGPGNSGGPLADALGRVVGLNAMIVGGLALAVPMSRVIRFVRGAGVEAT